MMRVRPQRSAGTRGDVPFRNNNNNILADRLRASGPKNVSAAVAKKVTVVSQSICLWDDDVGCKFSFFS